MIIVGYILVQEILFNFKIEYKQFQ